MKMNSRTPWGKHISYQQFRRKSRFDTEAKSNSEMTCWMVFNQRHLLAKPQKCLVTGF